LAAESEGEISEVEGAAFSEKKMFSPANEVYIASNRLGKTKSKENRYIKERKKRT